MPLLFFVNKFFSTDKVEKKLIYEVEKNSREKLVYMKYPTNFNIICKYKVLNKIYKFNGRTYEC